MKKKDSLRRLRQVVKVTNFVSKTRHSTFLEILMKIYDLGFQAGVKQEKRRQTIAYNKACDKFGI